MDKPYTKEELQKKNVLELKDILRKYNLKLYGKKEEIIKRILDDQPQISKPTKKFEGNYYFDILPKDITNIVNKYRKENEPNNKIAEELIKGQFSYSWGSRRDVVNKLLERIGVQARLVEKTLTERLEKDYEGLSEMEWYGDEIISDEILIEFLNMLLIREYATPYLINSILNKYNSNIGVIIIPLNSLPGKKKERFKYIIGYFKPVKVIESSS